MQSRLLAFLLPVFILSALVLGGLAAAEATTRISLEGEQARSTKLERLVGEVATSLRTSADAPEDLVQLLASASTADQSIFVTLDGQPAPAGRVPSAREAELIDAALPPDTTVWPWTDGDFLDRISVPSANGEIEVALRTSTDPTQARVSRYLTILGMIVTTMVALIAAGLYPLTRWALHPIRDLDETATALASGDLSARATVRPGAPEIKRLADSFNGMAEQLAAGIHRERAFVASASHHFGNLLTPLRLRVELIADDDPMVHEALAELDRLEMVAERLLELNHAEEDSSRAIMLDVGAVIDDTVRSWRAVTEQAGIELTRSGTPSVIAWAVPGSVDEMLDNLINNSIKYAEGAPIAVRLIKGLHNVRITVTDGGPGMTPDEIQHAEGRFWRGATQQSKPGSGLGLAIVDALVTRSGGHFEMRTLNRGGLECSIVLKRATTAPGESPVAAANDHF